jgi:hypothetical protein
VRTRPNVVSTFTTAIAVGIFAVTGSPAATSAGQTPWSRAVTDICAHALLFEESHEIGTRAGALAVAADIRSSTERRLLRIRALPMVPPQRGLTSRWLFLEQRLADAYASSFVGILDAIAGATTAPERAQLPRIVRGLLHAPDALRRKAASLEMRLHVPDCTGGSPSLTGETIKP